MVIFSSAAIVSPFMIGMSAHCLPPIYKKPTIRNDGVREAHGFTLLEMLIVLTLIALIAGIAVPNFVRMMESFTASTKWSELLNEVDGLPYRAYANGKSIRLSADSAPQLLNTLPLGWTISVETSATSRAGTNNSDSAIHYRENGWCDGGRITFKTREGAQRTVVLAAPRCAASAS